MRASNFASSHHGHDSVAIHSIRHPRFIKPRRQRTGRAFDSAFPASPYVNSLSSGHFCPIQGHCHSVLPTNTPHQESSPTSMAMSL
ncbi:hypothetical protein FOVSG1_007244 [Fusarium oxysporum f. sp. vasinfectum]